MENLNAEQIIKALECCIVNDWNSTKCNECPIYNGGGGCIDELKEATLTLINSQERKIKELENRLKECENGYEGTLALERAKVKELTDDNAWCAKRILEADKKNKELTEENERLHASYTELTQCCTKLETLYKIECKRVDTVKADTVRKMQERLKAQKFTHKNFGELVYLEDIDQIAKEMLEGL